MNNKGFNIKAIIAWCLYDWGVTAFPVIVSTFVIATYFTSKIALNPVVGTHLWGDSMAIAGIVVAVFCPIIASIATYHGKQKSWIALFTIVIILSSALLWYAYPNPSSEYFTLACVILGTIALNFSMVFYNAILLKLVPSNYIGRLSGWGWGVGYFGGLAILFIAFYGFVNNPSPWLNHQTFEHIRICGPLVALWCGLFTLPFFFFYSDKKTTHLDLSQAISVGLKSLILTIKMLLTEKRILIFLIAQMIYIDGLNTLFAFAGIYAAGTFHMGLSEVLLFGIIMNAFAGVGCVIFAWVDDFIGAKLTILISLFFLMTLGLAIVIIDNKMSFWIMACCLSLFVGPTQSASRSLMAHLVPKEKAIELFGFYAFAGRISIFIGPWILGFMTFTFNSQRAGMASILVFFVIGAAVLLFVRESTIMNKINQKKDLIDE